MVVLWVTSAQRVKHAMKAASWKRVQRLAYPFYVLTYVHLALLLMPSAVAGNEVAVLSIAVYSVVMGAYVVLRLRKAAADRRPGSRPGVNASERRGPSKTSEEPDAWSRRCHLFARQCRTPCKEADTIWAYPRAHAAPHSPRRARRPPLSRSRACPTNC